MSLIVVQHAPVYLDDDGERHLTEEHAHRANREIAKREVGKLLVAFDIYGVGHGYSDHQIDIGDLVESLVENRDTLVKLLQKAGK